MELMRPRFVMESALSTNCETKRGRSNMIPVVIARCVV